MLCARPGRAASPPHLSPLVVTVPSSFMLTLARALSLSRALSRSRVMVLSLRSRCARAAHTLAPVSRLRLRSRRRLAPMDHSIAPTCTPPLVGELAASSPTNRPLVCQQANGGLQTNQRRHAGELALVRLHAAAGLLTTQASSLTFRRRPPPSRCAAVRR